MSLMRTRYLLFISLFMLSGCVKEQFRGDDGDFLVDSFLNPSPAQRVNSSVLNTANLPIADDEVHEYLRQVQVAFLNHRGDWPAVRQQVLGIVDRLMQDGDTSSSSRANQLHIIGFKCYNEYLKQDRSLAQADEFSAVIFRPLLSTECVDYGMLSYFLELADQKLSQKEQKEGITYIRKGIAGILKAGQPDVQGDSRARILYSSALEAEEVLTRINQSKR